MANLAPLLPDLTKLVTRRGQEKILLFQQSNVFNHPETLVDTLAPTLGLYRDLAAFVTGLVISL